MNAETVELVYLNDATLGECPRWHKDTQTLYWVDIHKNTLFAYQLEKRVCRSRRFDFKTAAFGLTAEGSFVLSSDQGFYFLSDLQGEVQFLGNPEAELSGNRFNDGAVDRLGRFVIGSLGDEQSPTGQLHSLNFEQSQQSRVLARGFKITNGLAFSPDDQFLYFTDTPSRRVVRYRYDLASGSIDQPSTFYQFDPQDGYPDGAAVDAEGNYWIAMYGGSKIVGIRPDGRRLMDIPLPVSQPTMVCFGGDDFQTLYITSASQGLTPTQLEAEPLAGSVLAVRSNYVGNPGYSVSV